MYYTLIDTPWKVLLLPTIENVTAWLAKLKAMEETPEVTEEIRIYEKHLETLLKG